MQNRFSIVTLDDLKEVISLFNGQLDVVSDQTYLVAFKNAQQRHDCREAIRLLAAVDVNLIEMPFLTMDKWMLKIIR